MKTTHSCRKADRLIDISIITNLSIPYIFQFFLHQIMIHSFHVSDIHAHDRCCVSEDTTHCIALIILKHDLLTPILPLKVIHCNALQLLCFPAELDTALGYHHLDGRCIKVPLLRRFPIVEEKTVTWRSLVLFFGITSIVLCPFCR